MALHFAVHLSGWSLLRAHRALEIKLPLVRIDARLIAPQALARLTRSLRRRRGSFGGRMAPDHVGCGGDCFHLRLGGSSEARGWSTSAHSSEASILRGLLKRLANCACHSSKAPPACCGAGWSKGFVQLGFPNMFFFFAAYHYFDSKWLPTKASGVPAMKVRKNYGLW